MDTGNQSRETIISEDLFYRISEKGAKINKESARINGISDSMNILGRTEDLIELEFYSPSPKYPKKLVYPCRPLVARGVNINFLLSNADLCRMDVSLRPAHGAMYLPITGSKRNKALMVPLTKKPPRPSPVYMVQDEVIRPGMEMQFLGKVNQKIGRDVEAVLDDVQLDSDQLPLVGACT